MDRKAKLSEHHFHSIGFCAQLDFKKCGVIEIKFFSFFDSFRGFKKENFSLKYISLLKEPHDNDDDYYLTHIFLL